MITRFRTPEVERALSRQAAVALLGPRQVGKTTLALEVGEARNAVYLDLERSADRNRLAEPRLYFDSLEGRLIVLDEVHRMPDLFAELRGVIDESRRRGQRTGLFLLLGSASLDLLQQSETLAGRISYIDLPPFHPIEIPEDDFESLWVRGGFPDSFLADSDSDSLGWRRDYVQTYLEREVASFGFRIPATTLERLWTMLAHRQGSILNASDLSRSLEISSVSVARYLDLLCDLLLVRRLPPYASNTGKRLVKSPKVYVRDSGLVHALLGIETLGDLLGHPIVGASWEGFVIESILNVIPRTARVSYYRTADGAEADLILEFPTYKRWVIEIKRSPSAKPSRGFPEVLNDLKPERALVVHGGKERFPLSATIEAIGLTELCREMLELRK